MLSTLQPYLKKGMNLFRRIKGVQLPAYGVFSANIEPGVRL